MYKLLGGWTVISYLDCGIFFPFSLFAHPPTVNTVGAPKHISISPAVRGSTSCPFARTSGLMKLPSSGCAPSEVMMEPNFARDLALVTWYAEGTSAVNPFLLLEATVVSLAGDPGSLGTDWIKAWKLSQSARSVCQTKQIKQTL